MERQVGSSARKTIIGAAARSGGIAEPDCWMRNKVREHACRNSNSRRKRGPPADCRRCVWEEPPSLWEARTASPGPSCDTRHRQLLREELPGRGCFGWQRRRARLERLDLRTAHLPASPDCLLWWRVFRPRRCSRNARPPLLAWTSAGNPCRLWQPERRLGSS